MTTITNSDRALKDITVGKRIRHDLGDIDALAKSITERGLLHPIVISPMGDLLAGHRRLEAVRSLGWEAVPVRVVTDVADMRDALNIERDENTQRKPFTPSEADALARTIEALEKPKARERKARPGSERSAKLAEQAPRPRDVAAEATGLGHETLRKARAVVVMPGRAARSARSGASRLMTSGIPSRCGSRSRPRSTSSGWTRAPATY